MSVHGNMLQSALPISVSCTSVGSDVDNHNNIKMEHDSFNDTELVEKGKSRSDCNDTGEKDKEKKIRRHVCDLCYKRFTQAGALKTHMLTHTGYKPFVCVQCGKAFSLACNLKRHELLHTGEKPFLCDICSKAFTRASHLKGHKRIHTGERPYKCPHCEADFNQSNHVRKHIKKVHGGDDVSELAFPACNDLEGHKRIQSKEQGYVCADAGNGSAGSGYLHSQSRISTEEHLPPAMVTSPTAVPSTKIMSGEDMGQGKQNMENSREELLQSLIKRKHGVNLRTRLGPRDDEIIYCEECDGESLGDCPQHSHFQRQRKPASLAASNPPHQPSSIEGTSPHKSANTGVSPLPMDKNHLCQLCSSAFIMFNSLKLHMMCIHGEKVRAVVAVPSLSEDCGVDDQENEDAEDCDDLNKEHDNVDSMESVEKTKGEVDSQDSSSKRRKRKTHRQTCDVCFKSFTDLRTHKLTHTGYKQFECGTCNKSFTHACNLKAHELTHTGQKPFVCDMCGKAFTRDCHLKAHKRIHTGERPYKCPHCDADFNQSNHVQKHIRTVHSGNRRFVCRFCGGNFSRTTDLHKHTKIHLRGKKSLQFRFPKEQTSISAAEELVHSDPLSSDQDF